MFEYFQLCGLLPVCTYFRVEILCLHKYQMVFSCLWMIKVKHFVMQIGNLYVTVIMILENVFICSKFASK